MEQGTDETGQMTQEAGVLGDLEQAEKERHDSDQADRQINGATGGGEDGVGERLHLASVVEVVDADGNHLRVQGLYVVVSPCQLAELSPAVSSPKGPVEDHYQILVVPVGLQ